MLLFKGKTYAEVLTTIHAQCFTKPWKEDQFTSLLDLPSTFGFIDEKGFILCSDLGQDIEILTLAVLPEFRRKGLASALLNFVQKLMKIQNKKSLFLEVNCTNEAAIALYKKNGFQPNGTRKNYYHENGATFDALCFIWQNPSDLIDEQES